MSDAWRLVVLFIGIAWVIQYLLAFIQLRRFYRRVNELRRHGSVYIGKAGSTWRLKVYAVLVLDKEKRIRHAEHLSGWTFLAKLRPLPGLEGIPMEDLFDDTLALPVTRKQLLALRNAAEFILEAEERKEKRLLAEKENVAAEDENPSNNASTITVS